jgi:ABC-type multidrug transport system permease subunit
MLRGELSVYPFYATTDAFLYYEAMERAGLEVMEAIDGEYRTQLVGDLSLGGLAAVATQSPVTVVGTALYNPIEGYGVYLIPSVLMIIIFQTLMMLVAMMSNRKSEHTLLASCASMQVGRTQLALSLVCGKTLTNAVLYAIFALFLVGFLPLLFDIPHAASWGALVVLLIPYILGTSFLGLALSRWYTDAEAPILLIAFFSIGLIFLSGVSYPLELIPWYWQVVHYLIPAAPATLAYVQLSSMGATLGDVWPQLLALWGQMAVYFVLAVQRYRRL